MALVWKKLTKKQQPNYDDQVVEVSDVMKTFQYSEDAAPVLRNINISIPKGSFTVLTGPSGSGKSTLLNMVAGLDKPSDGRVYVNGKPIYKMRENRLNRWRGRNVGVVLQSFELLQHLTLGENVLLPMQLCKVIPRKQRVQRMEDLLERMGVLDLVDKHPHQVSGGQQQRAAIARALANQPPVIVADEPTGSLDTRTSEQIIDLFRSLTEAGTTILMVTHDLEQCRWADYIIKIRDGKILQVENRRSS